MFYPLGNSFNEWYKLVHIHYCNTIFYFICCAKKIFSCTIIKIIPYSRLFASSYIWLWLIVCFVYTTLISRKILSKTMRSKRHSFQSKPTFITSWMEAEIVQFLKALRVCKNDLLWVDKPKRRNISNFISQKKFFSESFVPSQVDLILHQRCKLTFKWKSCLHFC